jgi:hypothetical protein
MCVQIMQSETSLVRMWSRLSAKKSGFRSHFALRLKQTLQNGER